MSELWALVDSAVAAAIAEHPDYLTPKGQEAARKLLVRKVTGALRDSIAAPKSKPEPVVQDTEALITYMVWSKEWWAVLLRKIERKEPTAFHLQHAVAAQRGAVMTAKRGDLPSDDVLESFAPYPSDGYAIADWRPWFEAHGVRLPEWRERMWVFLPSAHPPSSTGPPSTGENAA